MSEFETPPDGWSEIDLDDVRENYDVDLYQTERAFQRKRDGLVLAIEEGTNSSKGRYCAAFLPENFYDDSGVHPFYGEGGYLQGGKYPEDALEPAFEWMAENPRD